MAVGQRRAKRRQERQALRAAFAAAATPTLECGRSTTSAEPAGDAARCLASSAPPARKRPRARRCARPPRAIAQLQLPLPTFTLRAAAVLLGLKPALASAEGHACVFTPWQR